MCSHLGVCPSGGWCDGQTFFLCPRGKYNPSNNSGSPDVCKVCPPGYFCQNSGTVDYTPHVCPVGYYCPAATKYPQQFPCPAGTYNGNTTQTSQAACKPCPAREYCIAGSSKGTACPPGYYCPEGTSARNQFSCPAGTYNDVFGLMNYTECKTCPAGHYCPDGSSTEANIKPIACPPGTYYPFENVGHVLNCRPCTAGFYCPRAGQVNVTDACFEGYYCPNGTVSGSQFPCPSGSYGNGTDLTAAEQCSICPRGKSCGWATGIVNGNPWQPCQPGHFCPYGKSSLQDHIFS